MGKEKKDNQFNFYPYLFEIGYRISIPLVFLVVLGAWLDRRIGSSHLFLFLGIFLSLFSSALGIYRTIKKVK